MQIVHVLAGAQRCVAASGFKRMGVLQGSLVPLAMQAWLHSMFLDPAV